MRKFLKCFRSSAQFSHSIRSARIAPDPFGMKFKRCFNGKSAAPAKKKAREKECGGAVKKQ
jgi:hypothetical protein